MLTERPYLNMGALGLRIARRAKVPKDANSLTMSGLTCRIGLVGTGRDISVLLGINGLRNKPSFCVGPPFLAFTTCFSATPGWHFPRALIESLLTDGCG